MGQEISSAQSIHFTHEVYFRRCALSHRDLKRRNWLYRGRRRSRVGGCVNLKLKCTDGPLKGEVIEVTADAPLVLGRDPTDEASVVRQLPSKTVSKNHCRIEFANSGFRIIDLKSSNGIRLNREKVSEAALKSGDHLQIGEFSFVVEAERDALVRPLLSFSKGGLRKLNWQQKLTEVKAAFSKLDLPKRALIVLMIAGILAHWILSLSMMEESYKYLLGQSYEIARQSVRELAMVNQSRLQQDAALVLDCHSIRSRSGIEAAFILNAQGKVICPISSPELEDSVTATAVSDNDEFNNCKLRVEGAGLPTCDFITPMKILDPQLNQTKTIGFARIEYRPAEAQNALQSLQTVKWKTLFLTMALLLGVWWLMLIWMRREVESLTEAVHVVSTGNSQAVEKTESFAALNVLVDEVNRLITKGFHGVKANSAEKTERAGFLQSVFQQILLLEERPVMVVNKDNHLIAATPVLANVIPVNVEQVNAHITDIVHDTHLQGELMGFLNDLSLSEGPQERALTLMDRVVNVRGMPVIVSHDYVAAILIF